MFNIIISIIASGISVPCARAFRYWNEYPYSGTGLVLASAFLFIPVTDWPDAWQYNIPSFEMGYIHPVCPWYKQWTGIHPQVHTAGGEMGTPFTSILLAVKRDTPCTFILLAVERNTTLQPVCPYCWQWKRIPWKSILAVEKRIQPQCHRPYCWWLKGIQPASPYCWHWKWTQHACPYTAGSGRDTPCTSIDGCWLFYSCYHMLMLDCRTKFSPASAFLPVTNCPSPASAFRHQGRSGTAGHPPVKGMLLCEAAAQDLAHVEEARRGRGKGTVLPTLWWTFSQSRKNSAAKEKSVPPVILTFWAK